MSTLLSIIAASRRSAAPALHESFLAEFDAGAVRALYIAQNGDYSAGVWTDRSGLGNHTSQATGTKQPAFSATAINSLPGLTFDGGDCLQVALDLSAYTWVAAMVLFQDTDTAAKTIVEHGTNVFSGSGWGIFVNDAATGIEWAHKTDQATASMARSDTSITMASPAVVTGYGDVSLATNEAEIRHAGANVTSTRPQNANQGGNLGNLTLNIGSRDNAAALAFTGAIGFLAVIAGTGGVASHVAQLAAGEALVESAWGL